MVQAAKTHALYIRLRSTDGTWIAPPGLRSRLVTDAKREKSNLHDIAVGILAAHYKVAFTPSGRVTAPARDGEELNLRVSAALWRRIGATAIGSRQRAALDVLSGHYGLLMPKRPKRSRAAA